MLFKIKITFEQQKKVVGYRPERKQKPLVSISLDDYAQTHIKNTAERSKIQLKCSLTEFKQTFPPLKNVTLIRQQKTGQTRVSVNEGDASVRNVSH